MSQNESLPLPILAKETERIENLQNNEFLNKIMNSRQKYFFTDREPLTFDYRFGDEFIPKEVSVNEVVQQVEPKDFLWVPFSVAWSSCWAHWRYGK